MIHRHELTDADIGIPTNSFVSKLLRQQCVDKPLEELTEDESNHLGGWIRGLLDPEGSISDELMSSCRPQDFYLLVPTLFSQIVTACASDVISIETVKGALDCNIASKPMPIYPLGDSLTTTQIFQKHSYSRRSSER